MTRSVDTAHYVIAPGLFITTGFCSSGRSTPRLLTFCFLTTSLMRNMHSSGKEVFICILSNLSAVQKTFKQILNDCVCHPYSKLEYFEACRGTKWDTRHFRKMECSVVEGGWNLLTEARILKVKSFWKSSLACWIVFFHLFLIFHYPLCVQYFLFPKMTALIL